MQSVNSKMPSLESLHQIIDLISYNIENANEQIEILQEQIIDNFPEIWNELKDLTSYESIVAYKDKILSIHPDNDDLDMFMEGYVDYLKDLHEFQTTKSGIQTIKRIYYSNHGKENIR